MPPPVLSIKIHAGAIQVVVNNAHVLSADTDVCLWSHPRRGMQRCRKLTVQCTMIPWIFLEYAEITSEILYLSNPRQHHFGYHQERKKEKNTAGYKMPSVERCILIPEMNKHVCLRMSEVW